MKVSSVHERRCKVEDNDETTLQSRDGNRVTSRNSKHSEIRSRISGKETADPNKQREKLGPGDDQMIKMRILNSYKQIKFSGVGIGGKKNVFTKHVQDYKNNEAALKSIHSNGKAVATDDITKKDSIFPSDLDGED